MGLGPQVDERREGAAIEERLAQVLDAVFDPPLGLRVTDGGSSGLEEVVAGEVQEARIELDGLADVVQDHALQVVVEDVSGDAAEEFEGAAVHCDEGLQSLVEREVDEDCPRPGEDHAEGRERALRVADAEVAEVAPVDLGLLARVDLDAQINLARAGWPHLGQVAPERDDAEGVATLLDLGEEPDSGQCWVVGEALDDEGFVGIECALGSFRVGRKMIRQSPADSGVMDTEATGDGLDAPALDEHQPSHLGPHLGGDHR